MKIFRWLWLGYLAMCFLVSLYIGERYIYYATGLAGITPAQHEEAEEDLKYYQYQSFGWKICKGTLAAGRTVVASNVTVGLLVPIVKTFCILGTQQREMWEELFDSFGYSVFVNLMDRIYDVNYMCNVISVCDDYYYQTYKVEDYIDDMMKKQPKINREYPRETPQKLIKMFQISDAHVDRGYLEGTNTECKAPTCWRPTYGPAEGDERAGHWGFVGKWDIPVRTAEVGFEYGVKQNPDFIIWTGDNLDHYVWYQTFENQFFNQRHLKKYLVETLNYTGPIYPVLGNHEGVPSDMFSFTLNKWVFESFADIWKDYLTLEAYRNMSNYGYYHQKHLDTNLRIIGTFSMVYDTQNWYLVPNHTDPLLHLKFLEETLEYCEHNNEVAYLIGHIPPGDIFTLSEWSTRFRALVNRFTNIIRGQFYGHTHYDEFKNVKSFRNDEMSAGTVWAVPSLTSYPHKHPGLRMWEVDADTWHIWDYEQYRMYVNDTNAAADAVRQNPDYTPEELKSTGKWQTSYKFKDYYGVDNMDFESLAKLVERSKTNERISKKIITMMHCEGPDSIARIDEQYWTYWRFANSVFDDHWIWNGDTGNTLDYVFKGIQAAHGSGGDWWHKEPTEKYTKH